MAMRGKGDFEGLEDLGTLLTTLSREGPGRASVSILRRLAWAAPWPWVGGGAWSEGGRVGGHEQPCREPLPGSEAAPAPCLWQGRYLSHVE